MSCVISDFILYHFPLCRQGNLQKPAVRTATSSLGTLSQTKSPATGTIGTDRPGERERRERQGRREREGVKERASGGKKEGRL